MTRGNFSRYTLVFAAVCLVTALPSIGQGKPIHLKNDQLLAKGMAENGIGTDAATPWHIRASFETFDEKGQHKGGGTFEEWWAGSNSYKSVYTGAGFNQTDVATPAGLFRSGDQKWAEIQEALVQNLLISPMTVWPYDLRRIDLLDETRANGVSKMRCVFLRRKPAPDAPAGSKQNTDLNQVPAHCFEPDSTVLRYSSASPGYFIVYNDVVSFHSHFVARAIQQMSAGKPYVTVRVLELNALAPDNVAFTPPAGSSGPLGGRIVVPSERMEIVGGRLDFPPSIMRDLGAGDYSVKVIIGKDGHVIDSTTISAPPGLSAVVAKAPRKLIFAPFTILGTPVEVETTLEEKFRSTTSGDIQQISR